MQELFVVRNLVLYQDFASRQDSRRDPGGEFFLGRILAKTNFSAGFSPICTVGIFPGKDSADKSGLCGVPILILQRQ